MKAFNQFFTNNKNKHVKKVLAFVEENQVHVSIAVAASCAIVGLSYKYFTYDEDLIQKQILEKEKAAEESRHREALRQIEQRFEQNTNTRRKETKMEANSFRNRNTSSHIHHHDEKKNSSESHTTSSGICTHTGILEDAADFVSSSLEMLMSLSSPSPDIEHGHGSSNEKTNEGDDKSQDMSIFDTINSILQPQRTPMDNNNDDNEDGAKTLTTTIESSNGINTSVSVGTIPSAAKSFASLIMGEISEEEFGDMIHYAQTISQQNRGDVDETRSTLELIDLFLKTQTEVQEHLRKSLTFQRDRDGESDTSKAQSGSNTNSIASSWLLNFDPTSMFYYIEKEDEVKNPSWKRRKHRYCKGVDVSVVHGLNDALRLAEIAYLGTKEEIQKQLKEYSTSTSRSRSKGPQQRVNWQLINCQLDALPEEPSHFVAIKKGQSRWDPQLEVLIAVRGTNSVPDVLTDALLDATDYRDGGKAHAGILRSGKYLVEKHRDLLLRLLEKSKKKGIKLTLVGHSLGAGAAAIAGMEFQNDETGQFDVNVVGFGCPAILSKGLSEQTKDYITTVIADSDIIPRMSAETIGNVMLDMMDFDWTTMAKRDIEAALMEMRKSTVGSLLLRGGKHDNDGMNAAMNVVDGAVQKYAKPGIGIQDHYNYRKVHRLAPVLYPPGSCVHFYRDGVSISGSYVPCDFFNEIDVARTMVDDHTMYRGYRRIFLDVMRSFLSDDHFSFDGDSNQDGVAPGDR